MRLLNLHIENTFSILSADLTLNQSSLVLITGYSIDENTANGAGKSSLINKSLIWGLFGQTAGGLKGDEVINRHVDKAKAVVRINFEGNDNKEYLLERTRNPNGLKLVQNGTDISRKLEKDTQQLVEVALGRSFETFIQTDFFGQGKFASYLTLQAKDQKQVLEKILSLDKLSIWADKARELKGEAVKRLETYNLELAKLNGQKSSSLNFKESLTAYSIKWGNDKAQSIQALQEKLHSKSQELKESIDRKREVETRISLLTLKKDKALTAIQYANSIILNHESRNKELLTNEIPKLKAEALKWSDYRTKLETMPDNCPTCNAKIYKDHVHSELRVATAKETEAFYLLENAETTFKNLQSSIKEQERLVEAWSNRLKELETLKLELSYLNNTTSGIQELKDKIEQIKQEVSPYAAQLAEVESTIQALEPQIETINDNIAILNSRVEALTAWSNIFSKNFYAYVLSRACPFLEQRVAKHLEGLNNSQLKVKFQTVKELKSGETKDEFNIRVSSKTGGSGFDSLSGGEQQLVSFATGLALSDLAETQLEGKSNIIILDEPFVELDSKNQESVVEYINNYLVKQRESVFIISNDEHLKSLIPKRIHVIKEHGISRVELHV